MKSSLKPPSAQLLGVVVVTLLFLYGLVSLSIGIRNALLPRHSQDLAPVYRAARSWIHGRDPYELQRPRPGELPAGAPAAFSTPYAFPGVMNTALVAWLPWQPARVAWIAMNLILLMTGFPFVIKAADWEFTSLEKAALLALLWSGEGVRVCLGNGQHSMIVFVAIALLVWALQRRRDAAAGLALTLSLHKYSWTPFLAAIPLAKGRLRPFVAAGGIVIAELVVFVARIGIPTAVQAVGSYKKEMAWWSTYTRTANFDRFGFSQMSALWFEFLPRQTGTVVHWTIVAICAATAIVVFHRSSSIGLLEASIVSLLCLISVYHGIYDAVCLYFPIVAAFVLVKTTRRRSHILLFGGLCLIWFVDASKLSSLLGERLVPSLARGLDDLLRISLFIAMLWFIHLVRRRKLDKEMISSEFVRPTARRLS